MVTKRRRSRLTDAQQRAIIQHFVAGVTARTAAELLGLNRNTVTLYYRKCREVISAHLSGETPFMTGEVEVDESYFGDVRKGKRGRGAAGNVPVFGLLKHGGKVHTVMIPNARSTTLLPIMCKTIKPDSVVYTDDFLSYDVLDVSEFHHARVNHSEEFVRGRNHINGIENFWNQAKRHLRCYNGVPRGHFELFLKECDWCFNYLQ